MKFLPLIAVLLCAAPAAADECSENSALDGRTFRLVVQAATPIEVTFTFRNCEHSDRNDYEPPYATRSYTGSNGRFDLYIVTSESSNQSDVMLYERIQGRPSQFAGRLAGALSNQSLTGTEGITLGSVTVGNYRDQTVQATGKATLTPSAAR